MSGKFNWVQSVYLDRNSTTALYKQLANRLLVLMDQGKIKNGDVLYPERKLAETLGISRGTVRKAYFMLQIEGMVTAKHGGNYYVSGADKVSGRMNAYSKQVLRNAIDVLLEEGLLPVDIFSSFEESLMEAMHYTGKIRVGAVECREDMRYMFDRFFANYPEADLFFCEVSELENQMVGSELAHCDLVITTAAHYFEMLGKYPDLEPKTVEIITLWTSETIREISSIPKGKKIGIIYSNARTVLMVRRALQYFKIDESRVTASNEKNVRMLETFVMQQDYIIAEPSAKFLTDAVYEAVRRRFQRSGGSFVTFAHYIDAESERKIMRAITDLKWRRI